MRVNPVTDKVEPMFTHRERVARNFKSFMICAPYFGVIVFLNVIFLNLTGVIDPERHHALFQIEFLSQLCKPD